MNAYDQIQEAKTALQRHFTTVPRVGVVLGSGLGAFAESLSGCLALPYAEIPHFPQSSVEGHAGQLVVGHVGQTPVAVMSGRVHFYEGYSMAQVVFPVRVLAALGVQSLLVTNAAGAVNPAFSPGELMVITDHLNLTGDNPLRGHNDERLGSRFPDMSTVYGTEGQRALHDSAKAAGATLREGVYAGLSGPSYETPAEIRMLRTLGASAVGMSTVAEVIAARHAGLRVAGLSVLTNHAAGISKHPLSHEEVKEVAAQVRDVLVKLLLDVVPRLQ